MTLVPVLVGTDGGLTELGQASRTGGTLTLLPPGIDSEEGIWVKVASDGTLVEVADLSQLSNHGWAWKYPDHTGVPTLHQIRARCATSLGRTTTSQSCGGRYGCPRWISLMCPTSRYSSTWTYTPIPDRKIAFVGSTGAGKTTVTNLINRFYEIHGGTITCEG